MAELLAVCEVYLDEGSSRRICQRYVVEIGNRIGVLNRNSGARCQRHEHCKATQQQKKFVSHTLLNPRHENHQIKQNSGNFWPVSLPPVIPAVPSSVILLVPFFVIPAKAGIHLWNMRRGFPPSRE